MSIVNSAARAKILARDTEYKPTWVSTSGILKGEAAMAANGAGYWNMSPIYAIHVVQNDLTAGTHFIRVWFYDHDDDQYVDMDSGGFVLGEVYPIYLRKFSIVNASGVPVTNADDSYSFVGYQAKNMPYELS